MSLFLALRGDSEKNFKYFLLSPLIIVVATIGRAIPILEAIKKRGMNKSTKPTHKKIKQSDKEQNFGYRKF